jgi:hypothetical protein
MATRHVIVDWNGTLCEMIGDSVIVRRILLAIVRDALARAARGSPSGVVDVARFLRGNVAFRRVKRRYDAGEATLPELYWPIDHHVLRGAPITVIEGVLDAYAKANAGCVDDRMVAGLTTARELGATATIFSAAYDAGVHSILARQPLGDDRRRGCERAGGRRRACVGHDRTQLRRQGGRLPAGIYGGAWLAL